MDKLFHETTRDLRHCGSLADLKRTLEPIKRLLVNQHPQRDEFVLHYGTDFLDCVVDHVIPGWSPCMDPLERRELVNVFFENPASSHVQVSPPSWWFCNILLTATRLLESTHPADASQSATINSVVGFLVNVLEDEGFLGMFAQLLHHKLRVGTFVSIVAKLPGLVSNRLQHHVPDVFLPQTFFPMLFRDLFASVRASRHAFRFVQPFTERLFRVGHARAFVSAWLCDMRTLDRPLPPLDSYDGHRGFHDGAPGIYQRVMMLTGSGQLLEKLLFAVTHKLYAQPLLPLECQGQVARLHGDQTAHDVKLRMLSLVVGPVLFDTEQGLSRDEIIQDEDTASMMLKQKVLLMMTRKFLFARSIPARAFWAYLDIICMLPSPENPHSLCLDLAIAIAAVWCDPEATQCTDLAHQTCITGMLRGTIRRLSKQDIEQSGLLVQLVNGVQCHLQDTLHETRTLGMLVGEEFSRIIDPDNALNFDGQLKHLNRRDEYAQDEETKCKDAQVECSASKVESQAPSPDSRPDEPHATARDTPETSSSANDGDKTNGAVPMVVKNAWYASSSDEEEESDSDDEDLVPMPYSSSPTTPDATNDTQGNRPVYVSDCIKQLNSEKYDDVNGALRGLKGLIQRRPDELEFVAVSLTNVLLHLNNKFGIADFGNLRRSNLAALVAACPRKCVAYLSGQLYARNVALGTMLEILDVLVAAAQLLSAISPSKVTEATAQLLAHSTPVAPAGDDAQLGTVLRRWGRRKLPARALVKNEYAQYSSLFFYALLKRPVDSETGARRDLMLFEREPMLLARVLVSLGALLECSRNVANVAQLAKAALEILWWSRFSNHGEVRRASTFCFAQILVSVPPSVLHAHFVDELVEIQVWLVETAKRDSDEMCRAHARVLLQVPDVASVL